MVFLVLIKSSIPIPGRLVVCFPLNRRKHHSFKKKKKKVFEKGKAVNIVERRQRLIRIQETKDEEVKCLDFKM